jgi:hypothetical protein
VSWIKLQTNIWDNPKIDYLAHEVGLPIEMAVGLCSRIWCWFDEHTESGSTDRIGGAKVSRIVKTSVTQLRDNGHDIDVLSVTNKFIKCLVDINWLMVFDDGMCLPKWEEHNGQTAKARANDQKRQEKSRSKRTTVTDVTQECDTSVTREDKRREEERREETKSPPSQNDPKREEEGARPFFDAFRDVPDLERFLDYVQGNASMAAHGLTEDQWTDIWRKADATEWTTLGNGRPEKIQNWKLWADRQARTEKSKPREKQASEYYNPFNYTKSTPA